MKILRNSILFALSLFLMPALVQAQQPMQMPQVQPAKDVSEAELEQFAETATEINGIRMEMDSLVTDKLDDEGISSDRFREIMMSRQNPNAPQPELSTEEEEIVGRLQTFLQQLNTQVQQQQMTAIQNSDLSAQRFQSIAMALRTDQELAARFQEKIDEMNAEQ